MIVDDEAAVTTQMEARLENMGYDVTQSASSGSEAIEFARRFHPDAVLMDIVMPSRVDGINATRKINKEMDIPVIFMTAYADDKTVKRAIGTNPYGYIVKPFHEKGVKASIEVALHKKRMEQRLAEKDKQLNQSERMLRLITENMNDMVRLIDANGKKLYVSPSHKRVLGYDPEERLGRSVFEWVHPDDMEKVQRAFAEAVAGLTPGMVEYRVRHAEGHYVWLETTGNFVHDENGQNTVGVLNSRDITAHKQAEEEVQYYQEHIKLINQILRHDLTNDLVVIQSALNLYLESPEEEYLDEIFSRSGKCIELINRMRELESFLSRHSELKMYDMKDAIDETIKNYPFIDFKVKGRAHQVMADDSLVSVIDNIVRNAVIHGKADRITITTGKERDMCEVRIADNGTGIPDDIKANIFEEGFMHGDTGHTGIGLHIVEKAMESYGGYAWVEDNEPKGAVIVLRFRRVK